MLPVVIIIILVVAAGIITNSLSPQLAPDNRLEQYWFELEDYTARK